MRIRETNILKSCGMIIGREWISTKDKLPQKKWWLKQKLMMKTVAEMSKNCIDTKIFGFFQMEACMCIISLLIGDMQHNKENLRCMP